MMKLETPIGEFTTDSYKIPAEDTLAVSPAIISFSSDDYKIITIDQFIQITNVTYYFIFDFFNAVAANYPRNF